MMDRALIRVNPAQPSPQDLMGYFAEVFASMDERPRQLRLEIVAENEGERKISIGYEAGDPVFIVEGEKPAYADFRRRWIAEHPVPIVLKPHGRTRFWLIPTTGNRVKVRLVDAWWRKLVDFR